MKLYTKFYKPNKYEECSLIPKLSYIFPFKGILIGWIGYSFYIFFERKNGK